MEIPRFTRSLPHPRAAFIIFGSVLGASLSFAAWNPVSPALPDSQETNVIVVGFVGGFVRSDDTRHPEVRMLQQLSSEDKAGLHAAMFENRRRTAALEAILQWLDTNKDGRVSAAEKQHARIILFGHSWGGSAVINLARDLDARGIPVLMTIQIDSINKVMGHDCVIPANVAEAVNFYQPNGLVHGCEELRSANPHYTRILGSFRFHYSEQPSACRSYPWFDRHFLVHHNAMGCDPQVWSQVETQIESAIRAAAPITNAQGPAREGAAEAFGNNHAIPAEPPKIP